MRVAAIALALALGGCAMLGPGKVEEASPGVLHQGGPTPAQAQSMIHAGSTKADVFAALGKGNGVAFESGYEVWVYRWLGPEKTARSATEFVILFGPDGKVRKTRIRPGVAGD